MVRGCVRSSKAAALKTSRKESKEASPRLEEVDAALQLAPYRAQLVHGGLHLRVQLQVGRSRPAAEGSAGQLVQQRRWPRRAAAARRARPTLSSLKQAQHHPPLSFPSPRPAGRGGRACDTASRWPAPSAALHTRPGGGCERAVWVRASEQAILHRWAGRQLERLAAVSRWIRAPAHHERALGAPTRTRTHLPPWPLEAAPWGLRVGGRAAGSGWVAASWRHAGNRRACRADRQLTNAAARRAGTSKRRQASASAARARTKGPCRCRHDDHQLPEAYHSSGGCRAGWQRRALAAAGSRRQAAAAAAALPPASNRAAWSDSQRSWPTYLACE